MYGYIIAFPNEFVFVGSHASNMSSDPNLEAITKAWKSLSHPDISLCDLP